jgi:tetratricopeptide (TPR) repeat protein
LYRPICELGTMKKRLRPSFGRFGPGSGNHRLDELAGHVDLGMKRDAVRLARQLLKGSGINASEFDAALEAILIQADSVKPWKPLVEEAYGRLSKQGHRDVKSRMLAFYYSLREWESAYRFLPARPKTALDLLFAMETLLNLRKVAAAKSIQRKCLQMLKQRIDAASAAALLDALANYHAQIGELGPAEKYWREVAGLDEPLARGGMTGLVEIEVVRAMLYAKAGLLQIEEFRRRGVDGQSIVLPHNRDAVLAQTERDLKRYQKVLQRIVPSDELWRFGLNPESD